MKHIQGELLDIVYRHYPRGVGMVDGDIDIQLIYDSEEHARLVAAQHAPGARLRASRAR
jgi:hypothetical protein